MLAGLLFAYALDTYFAYYSLKGYCTDFQYALGSLEIAGIVLS